MVKGLAGVVSMIALASCTAVAQATVYQLSFSGNVHHLAAFDNQLPFNANAVPVPATTAKIGDPFSIRFRLDTVAAPPTPLYDTDPAINIYWSTVSNYRLKLGLYESGNAPTETPFASIQLWNGFVVPSVGPVDSFSISTLRNLASSESAPFKMRALPVSEHFHFHAFDFGATARGSDLIAEQPSLNLYGSQSASFGFLDASGLSIVALATLQTATISALPEPATWATLTLGFGVVGSNLRRRAKRPGMS